jgi:hypothetical protein
VGSSGVVRYQLRSGDKPVLIKDGKIEFVDGGRFSRLGIPTAIRRCWNGLRPELAAFMGLVHHTTPSRVAL